MKYERYRYKEHAKTLLQGKYDRPIIIMIIVYVVNLILGSAETSAAPKYSTIFPFEMTDPGNPGMAFLLTVISFLIMTGISYSLIKMSMYIVYQREIIPEEILFSGFKENYPRNLILNFFKTIYIILWFFLFIIPGIIKAYAYSMSFYLVNKEANLQASEAIQKSNKMTNGYKMDLFLLDLSYLGWYILGCFTLGILWLWIIPRHLSARTLYFEEIYANENPSQNRYEEL